MSGDGNAMGTALGSVGMRDPENAAVGYWSEKMPEDLNAWRSDYAVKPKWNDDGFYVAHTVNSQSGLKVWQAQPQARAIVREALLTSG